MPGGRPTKLTPEIIEKVKAHLPICFYIETLVDSLGIEKKTYYNWYNRGEAEARRMEEEGEVEPRPDEALYLQFFAAVKKAIADGAIAATALINRAAQESWQAAAWLLERRFPELWGRKDRKEITKTVTEQHNHNVNVKLTVQQAIEIARLLDAGATDDDIAKKLIDRQIGAS